MEQSSSNNRNEHVIDIGRSYTPYVSGSHRIDHSNPDGVNDVIRTLTTPQVPIIPLPPVASNSRNVAFRRRNGHYDRRSRSPLNSGLWTSIELVVNLSLIIAAVVILPLSRDEKPQAPLVLWIVGYTLGCFFVLPHLYWRYKHHNSQESNHESLRSHANNGQNNPREATTSFTVVVEEESSPTSSVSWFEQNISSPRFVAFVDHYKMALECFFAVWFVIGNVWVFGGHTSASTAPSLYRLCIVFLIFSCMGYAMPFILCAMICCCLPCIISIVGLREDMGQSRGASVESINALPTYKFKSKENENGEESDLDSPKYGGILAEGTDKERIISAENADCCICLAKYVDGDELHELPCAHIFHKDCVEEWLKINSLCPLCKLDVGITSFTSSV